IVCKMNNTDITKKGHVTIAWRRNDAKSRARKQRHRTNTIGKNTTCVFDSSASAKKISDKIYEERLRGFSSITTKHKSDNNVKNIARTFFSSEIHATDSTWIG